MRLRSVIDASRRVRADRARASGRHSAAPGWRCGAFDRRDLARALLSRALMVLLVLLIAGCGGAPKKQVADGPPDAVPRAEPKSRYGNMTSYTVFGKRYYTQASSRDHVERGSASWYGKKFHGRKTSSGERYDMHQMTAAHKTLPLPTYAMVTNLDNGRRVVVKVNDRGPFVGDRIIDLSYAAAKRLDMINSGIARVEVRSVDPRDHGKDGRDLLRLAAAAADTPASSETAKSVPTSRRSPAPMSAAPSAARTAAMQPRPGSSSSPAPAAASGLYVQVGAFGDRVNAEQLQSRLVAAVEEPVLVRPAPAPGSAPLYKVQVGPLRSPTDADALGRRLAALGINTSLIVTP